MAAPQVVKLLVALELMPLEDICEDAEVWREEIRAAITALRGTAMPADDPLRYDENGVLISEERLQRRLQIIIDSWPTFGLREAQLWPARKRRKPSARS